MKTRITELLISFEPCVVVIDGLVRSLEHVWVQKDHGIVHDA